MSNKYEKIGKKYEISAKAIETIEAAANEGLLKAWREFIDLEKMIELNLLIKEKDMNQVCRRQGMLKGFESIDNKIDDIIKELKKNVKE